jgi:hypothetical protein
MGYRAALFKYGGFNANLLIGVAMCVGDVLLGLAMKRTHRIV